MLQFETDMNQPVVFFDGDCSICSRLVKFLLKRSRKLQVVSLQSDIAKTVLNQNYTAILALNTMVLFENETFYLKSTAVLRIFRKMHGAWPLLSIFRIIPLFVRDKLYDIVARNRHKWFGNCETCLVGAKPVIKLNKRIH
jgi:predicted DCC family thiol-disulfide oxidoreductase YuxK